LTFILALAAVIIRAVTGPIFDYSETWQLAINTGTTIITFEPAALRILAMRCRAISLQVEEVRQVLANATIA
jgi:hypothetical protein